MTGRVLPFAVVLSIAAALPVHANECRREITAAAERHGIPLSVALTVARVESANNPLAMNIAGWPARAHSVPDGVTAVRKLKSAGIQSIDVGCMQINLKHHPGAFAHMEEAFDPRTNADYGVRFLKSLYEQKRSWGMAIASYHSSDPVRQDVYLRSVRKHFVSGRN